MAKYRFRGALNAAQFPLLTSLQSRTVIQPQLDNNVRTTQAFYGTNESADYSIPQLLYCENLIPTAEGVMSVGYGELIPATLLSDFDQAITLRDEDENNFLFCPAAGQNYIYTGNSGEWVSTNPITGAAGKQVSRAYVNGRTFICYEGLGLFEYDTGTGVFGAVAVTGISSADIRGIGASNNYLVAYSDITVYWSSLVNPTDFTPSITTGAGFSIPQDVKAKISAVIGIAGGFIIYTAKNAVAAVYTNNIRAPFTFKEISNAGGIRSYEQVTSDQSSGPQYAWTTGGLQKITAQGAEPVSAEISDFLSGKVWESWDSVNKQLIRYTSDFDEFQVKVVYIGSRFLVVSYSTLNNGVYNYALWFDTTLKRWGKLKIDHVDCFNYPYPNKFGVLSYEELSPLSYAELEGSSYSDLDSGLESAQPSKLTVGFLSSNGQVRIALLDYDKQGEEGVAVFGKFQLLRARLMTLQTLDLEGIYGSGAFTVTAIASLQGKNLDVRQQMALLEESTDYKRYAKRITGVNISIAIEGAISMTSYVLEVTQDGDR